MSNMAQKSRRRIVALRHEMTPDGWSEPVNDPTSVFIPVDQRHDYVVTMIEQVAAHHQLIMPKIEFFDNGVILQFRSRPDAQRFRHVLALPNLIFA